MKTVTLLALEDCTYTSIILSLELFDQVNYWWKQIDKTNVGPLFKVIVGSVDGKPVNDRKQILIKPDKSIHDIKHSDIVIIPGVKPKLIKRSHGLKELDNWIREQYAGGSLIAAMCTGTFLLARTGLLDQKNATTNWIFGKSFQKQFPQVKLQLEKTLTEDSGLICSGASTASYDVLFYLIRKYGSDSLVNICSKSTLMDPTRRNQLPYIDFNFSQDHADQVIQNAQRQMEDHFAEITTVEEVAQQSGISSRHFNRRFKTATGESPLAYLQKLRIESAKNQLENTTENFEQITSLVGYDNSSTFRKLFKRYTSLTPASYRKKYSKMYPLHS